MAEKKDDGKVRMRCGACGKRLKMPRSVEGRIFRCPSCKSAVISPLDLPDEGTSEEGPREKTPVALPQKRSEENLSPNLPLKERNEAIDKLTIFLTRENNRVGTTVIGLFRAEGMADEEKIEKLTELRRERSMGLRRKVDELLRELDQRIEVIRRHPAKDQPRTKGELKQKEEDKRDFEIFLKVMFGIEE